MVPVHIYIYIYISTEALNAIAPYVALLLIGKTRDKASGGVRMTYEQSEELADNAAQYNIDCIIHVLFRSLFYLSKMMQLESLMYSCQRTLQSADNRNHLLESIARIVKYDLEERGGMIRQRPNEAWDVSNRFVLKQTIYRRSAQSAARRYPCGEFAPSQISAQKKHRIDNICLRLRQMVNGDWSAGVFRHYCVRADEDCDHVGACIRALIPAIDEIWPTGQIADSAPRNSEH